MFFCTFAKNLIYTEFIKKSHMQLQVPYIIAGPCSAESFEQVITVAEAVKKAGAQVFRAGLWKPRTSPESFAGVGQKGIEWLLYVQNNVDIPVATEVATAEHTALCIENGIKWLWIGARTTANPFMVQQIADYLGELKDNQKKDIVILIKNPINPDIETWCGAIERILKAGIHNIIAVHRGFSDSITTREQRLSRNDALWSIPLTLHRRMPDIPLICDPSHLTGDNSLVYKASQQALDLGFDGLMIEVHPTPEKALSDAQQQLTPEVFADIITSLRIPKKGASDQGLAALRREIDEIDASLWQLIRERQHVAKEIGKEKHKLGITVYQEQRFSQILAERMQWARENGLPEEAVQRIMDALHEIAINAQL